MVFSRSLIFLAAAASFAAIGGSALALTCTPLSNFGPEGTVLSNTGTCVTVDGTTLTYTGPGSGFTRVDEGSLWIGEFDHGAPLIYDNGVPGAVTLDYAQTASSISHLAVQPNLVGPYMATLTAYLAGTFVGSTSYSGDNELGPEGTIPTFSFSAPAFDRLVLSTTNDGVGFALGFSGFGNGSVPEPAAWVMLLVGFSGLGAAMRGARRRTTSIAA